MPESLAGLDESEVRCLELAWLACAAGTIGVGALLLDGDGVVVAEGANGLFAEPVVGPLQGNVLAHAETNVLAQIGPRPQLHDHVLVTSLEPCAMCAGAIMLAGVGRVRVLAPDHLMAGLDVVRGSNSWAAERWAPREFSTVRSAVDLAALFAAHIMFMFGGNEHTAAQALRAAEPDLATRVAAVVESQILVELAADEAGLDEVVHALEDTFLA